MASSRLWLVIGVTLVVVIAAAALLWPQQDRASATGAPTITMNVSPSGHCDNLLAPTKCTFPTGKQFQLLIDASIPQPGGYQVFQLDISYGSLIYKPGSDQVEEVVWPDQALSTRAPFAPTGSEGMVSITSITSPDTDTAPFSNFIGTIVVLDLTCPSSVGGATIGLISQPSVALTPLESKPSSLAINCEALPTFTPTPTPTGPTALPTATQIPVPTPPGPPEISLNVKGGNCDHPTKPSKCTIVTGASFTLSMAINNMPPGGYVGWQAELYYGALSYKPTNLPEDEIVWPDSVIPLRSDHFLKNLVGIAALTGLGPYPVSTYLGNIVELKMNCTATPGNVELAMPVFVQGHSLGGLFVTGSDGGTAVPLPSIGQRDVPPFGLLDVGALLDINCVAPTPTPTATPTPDTSSVLKSPQLSNLFLTAQGTKVPPATCLFGSDGVILAQTIDVNVGGVDKAGDPRELGGFSFKVNYDETKVCIELRPGPLALAWQAAGGGCIIQDALTKPTLQGSATIACNSLGKAPLSPAGGDNLTLAEIVVRPMPDEYSLMKPGNGNGNVVHLSNKACKLTDRQGDPIAPPPGAATCTDADVTIRYLEGDVVPDCEVDTLDTQAVAFRWGAQKGTLLYSDFFNTEPSKPQQDDDIDINDLQFVYGRFGSTCENPHPDQDPVNPKAA